MVKEKIFFQFSGSLYSKVGAFNQGWASTSTASTRDKSPTTSTSGWRSFPLFSAQSGRFRWWWCCSKWGKPPPKVSQSDKTEKGSEVEKTATWGVSWFQVLQDHGVIELETVMEELWQLSFSRHANCIEWLWFQFLSAKLSLCVRSFWSYIPWILRRIS